MNRSSLSARLARCAATLALAGLAPASGCAQSGGDPTRDPRFQQAETFFEAWLSAHGNYSRKVR